MQSMLGHFLGYILTFCFAFLLFTYNYTKQSETASMPVLSNNSNNSSKNRRLTLIPDLLFFNSIPKTGSTTFHRLLTRLSRKGEIYYFRHSTMQQHRQGKTISVAEQKALLRRLEAQLLRPFVYKREMHVIDYSGIPGPTFFSVMRDPFERFRSRFAFSRNRNGNIDLAKRSFLSAAKLEPGATLNKSFEEWRKETLEDCILNDGNKGCNFKQGQKIDHQISYFCGQDDECSKFGSNNAAQMAKANVERLYPVVGILENLYGTILALRNAFPFMSKLTHRGDVFRPTQRTENVSRTAENKMKKILALEYDLYDFLNARLNGQLQKIRLKYSS